MLLLKYLLMITSYLWLKNIYIKNQRMEWGALFNFKNHISDSGEPVEWLSSIIKGQILKDKMLYDVNQVLRS